MPALTAGAFPQISAALNTDLRIGRVAGLAIWAVNIRTFGSLSGFLGINQLLVLTHFELNAFWLRRATAAAGLLHSRVFVATIWAGPLQLNKTDRFFCHYLIIKLSNCNFDGECTEHVPVFIQTEGPNRSVIARCLWRVNVDDRGDGFANFNIADQEGFVFIGQLCTVIVHQHHRISLPGFSPGI